MWVSVEAGCRQTFSGGGGGEADEVYAHFTFAYRRSSVLFSLVTQLTNWWNFGNVVESDIIITPQNDNKTVWMPSLAESIMLYAGSQSVC